MGGLVRRCSRGRRGLRHEFVLELTLAWSGHADSCLSSPAVDEGDDLSWNSIVSRIDSCISTVGEPNGASRSQRPMEQSFAQQSRTLVCASLQVKVSLHSSCTRLALQGTRLAC